MLSLSTTVKKVCINQVRKSQKGCLIPKAVYEGAVFMSKSTSQKVWLEGILDKIEVEEGHFFTFFLRKILDPNGPFCHSSTFRQRKTDQVANT